MSENEQPGGLRLRWSRTVIGGQTAPYDFAAWDDDRFPNQTVARIYWKQGGNIGSGWFWSMPLLGRTGGRSYGPAQGTADTKDEAARECEAAYYRFLAALLPSETRQ